MEPQQDNQTPTTTPTAEAPAPTQPMPSEPMPTAATPPPASTPPAAPAAKSSGSNKMWFMILGVVVILAIVIYFMTK